MDAGALSRLLTPYEADDLQWFPVTTAMSKADFQGPTCCTRVTRKVANSKKPVVFPRPRFLILISYPRPMRFSDGVLDVVMIFLAFTLCVSCTGT